MPPTTPPMTYRYLRFTEPQAELETWTHFAGAAEWYPKVLDAALRLPCFLRLPNDPIGFGSWAAAMVMSAAHTCHAALLLWSRANYLETTILVRHLFEVLVQIAYFGARRDAFLPYHRRAMARAGGAVAEGQPVKEVKFKEMFDSVMPGFYKTHYGAILSGSAHGGLAATIFRVDYASPDTPGVRLGSTYDERWATFGNTYLQYILRALLQASINLDPRAIDACDPESRQVVTEALSWLDKVFEADWTEFPSKRPLILACSDLTGWKPPPPGPPDSSSAR